MSVHSISTFMKQVLVILLKDPLVSFITFLERDLQKFIFK